MSSFAYFSYLAGVTLEVMAYLAIVTVALECMLVFTLAWSCGRPGFRRAPVLVSLLAQALIPACVLTVGVAFVRPEFTGWPEGVHPPVAWFTGWQDEYPRTLTTTLVLLHLPVGLGLGWWARRGWPVAAAATLWWGWVSVCSAVVAEMSYTGGWL